MAMEDTVMLIALHKKGRVMKDPLFIWETALSEAEARHFAKGTPVYDSRGVKLGTVSPFHNQGEQGAMLLVRWGRFFPHDVAIPLAAVAAVDAQGIRLRYTKVEVERQAWAAPSAAEAAPPLLALGGMEPNGTPAAGIAPLVAEDAALDDTSTAAPTDA